MVWLQLNIADFIQEMLHSIVFTCLFQFADINTVKCCSTLSYLNGFSKNLCKVGFIYVRIKERDIFHLAKY